MSFSGKESNCEDISRDVNCADCLDSHDSPGTSIVHLSALVASGQVWMINVAPSDPRVAFAREHPPRDSVEFV